ncbi:PREDICTED: protein lethal(2)denticleless-like [Ceratosolen solmsi marchali]|uniref:Protein lethal(2)denticleless-like n=1 Tax=Ceratosolen solmsi marchali TaxID=326594 RepID=A0AAJ6YEH4_9HYME|nr:PREDICTED: protein lethal(2)denticleless-like [Ceratosolen solmsi marchali]
MNIVNSITARETGLKYFQNNDIALLRLKCYREDAYQGVSANVNAADYNPKPPIFACKFSSANQYSQVIALVNEDGKLALQDTTVKYESQEPLEGIQAHNNAIFDIAWMPQELKLITASGDLTACLWDVSSEMKQLQVFAGHTNSIKSAVFRNQDKAVFATGARDGAIMIWDIRASHSGQPKPDNLIFNAHEMKVSCGGKQRKLLSQSVKSCKSQSVTALAFQDDYTLFSCSAGDGLIKAWDLRKNYTIHKKEPIAKHTMNYGGKSNTYNGFTSLLICPSGITMYASCVDKKIYAYNLSSYNPNPIAEYHGHGSHNKMLTFFVKACLSPDGKYLASGSNNESGYIWHTRNPGKPLIRLSGHRDEVTCVAWCNSGETKIVTCSDDSCHRVWRVRPEEIDEDEKINIFGYAERYEQQSNLELECNQHLHTRYKNANPKLTIVQIAITDSPSKLGIADLSPENRGLMKCTSSNKRLLSSPHKDARGCSKRANLNIRATRELKFRPNCELVPSTSPASFSPTLDLPNFVVDGTAPHLSNSPKKFKENLNWLTEIRKRKNACKIITDNFISSKISKTPTRRIGRVRSTELRKMSKNSSCFMPAITNFYSNLSLEDGKATSLCTS